MSDISGAEAISNIIQGNAPSTYGVSIGTATAPPADIGSVSDAIPPSDPAAFQAWLNAHGANIAVDGIIGPQTRAAAAALGVQVPGDNTPPPPTNNLQVQGGDVSDPITTITRVAQELGVDPKLAIAIAQEESGLDPNSKGDYENGRPTSFGLYNLHEGGELGNMSPESVMGQSGMELNARTALTEVKAIADAHPDWSPGQIAAAAQRPLDPVGYAQKINGLYNGGTITGGGGGGVSGGGAGSTPAPQQLSPAEITAQMKLKYGYLGSLLDHPDIANALGNAIANNLPTDEALASLYQTNTWRTMSDSQRNWEELQSTDPASAQAKLTQQQADINSEALKLGVTIAPDRLAQIANDSLKFGWNNTQIQSAIGAEFHYAPGGQSGTIGQSEVSLKDLAKQYLVPLDDPTLASYEQQIANGTATADDFRIQFVQHAQSLFPGLASQITGNNPTQNVLSPWKNTISNELGIAPDTIDFSLPKYNRFVNQVDPKTGVATPMSLYDTQRTLRSDPTYGWSYTKNGQDSAYQFQQGFLQAIGKVPA